MSISISVGNFNVSTNGDDIFVQESYSGETFIFSREESVALVQAINKFVEDNSND